MNTRRGSGRTTEQLRNAKKFAAFVWIDGEFGYPKALIRALGRTDILIISPYDLEQDHLLGRLVSEIVVDHAVCLTASQNSALDKAQARIKLQQE